MIDDWMPAPDERGLMPLDAARAWLAGRTEYVKGDGAMVGGRFVLESDRTWAALLSLADADEFLAVARGMRWRFHVRGMDNTSLYERYGDGILPWIADRIDVDGVLHNVPWCVVPCLFASAHPDAFDIAARVGGVSSQIDAGRWPSPPDEVTVLCQWVVRHPEPGYRLLGERARAGDDRVVAALRELHDVDPRGTRRHLADDLCDRLGLSVPALPEPVVAALTAAPRVDLPASRPLPIAGIDEVLDDGTGPAWDNANIFCAAMRLTGFVDPGGTDGLVFQALTDDSSASGVVIGFHPFGFDGRPVATRWHQILDHDATELLLETGGEVALPNGTVRVKAEADLDTLLLAVSADRETRDRLFLTPEQLVRTLGLPETARALFVLDEWHHPAVGEAVADSLDLVLAVEALRERRAITASLTGKTRDEHLRERFDILG